MGAGNYLPPRTLDEGYEMVYIDFDQIYGDDPDYDHATNNHHDWNDFKDNVIEIAMSVSDSLSEDKRWITDPGFQARTLLVVLSNGLGVVGLQEDQSYASVVVGFESQDECTDNLARRWVDQFAPKLWKALVEHYTLRVRSGPWTSSTYTP